MCYTEFSAGLQVPLLHSRSVPHCFTGTKTGRVTLTHRGGRAFCLSHKIHSEAIEAEKLKQISMLLLLGSQPPCDPPTYHESVHVTDTRPLP